MISDLDLLRAYGDGDESALAALIARYHRLVRAACQRQAPVGEIDDCVQAVFLVLSRRPAAAAQAPALVAWLYRVCVFVCRNAHRRARNRPEVQATALDERASATSAVEHELSAELDAALLRLGERQRAAVLLHVVSGESAAGVGERLGVSRENAKKLIQRGIAALRQHLGRHGPSLGTASLAALLAPTLSAGEQVQRLTTLITTTPSPHGLSLAKGAITSMKITSAMPWAAAAGLAVVASGSGLVVAMSAEKPQPLTPPAATEVSVPAPSDSFTIAKDQRVSLAVYDAQGRLVRTLLTGAPRAKGTHRVEWDGLDRYGAAMPAGTYTWKMLASDGLRAEFLTQIGQNVDPAWERASGNHMAPNGAAIDATGLYRIGATNEGAHWGVKTDLAGKHLWTNDRWAKDPWVQESVAVTLVSERLFELLPNGDCYGYSTTTGHVFTGGDFDPKPWSLRRGPPAPAGESDEARRKREATLGPGDIAGDATNGLLVALYPRDGVVQWFSAKDGSVVDTMTGLERAVALAVDRSGAVFVIRDGVVERFTRTDKTPRVVIAKEALQDPWRISVSAVSGEIFVAENSDLAQTPAPAVRHCQVKRFQADGRLLATFGRPEGRRDGAYVPTDFRGLTDIEADHVGGFIITEGQHTPPRRTARFAKDGTLLREWYGAQHYGVLACPEPGDPSHVWTRANAPVPGYIRYQVDYQTRSWKIVEIYQDALAQNPQAQNAASHGSAALTMFAHQGRIYQYDGNLGALSLRVYDPLEKRLRPCASSGGGDRGYLWTDLNDDGLASDDEVVQLGRPLLGGFIDPRDLSLTTTPGGTRDNPGHRLVPVRVTAGGTPVYDFTKAKPVAPWQEDGQFFYPFDLRRAEDGSWYGSIAHQAKNPHEGAESHGAWYYNSCSAIDRLVKWDKDRTPLFSVGRHSPDNDHETGSTAMPRGLVGLTRGCVVWGDASDEETCRPTVWTEDGLYVDELLRVPLDQTPAVKYGEDNTNEYPTGHLATDPTTGDTLFYALNSGGGSPIYRISGWDGWQRASGTLTLKTQATQVAKRAGTGLNAEYFNSPDCSGTPALTRKDELIFFNWGKGTPDAKITADKFSVRWSGSYEALTNEDVRFEIRGNFPWRDKGHPTWAKLWLGGQVIFDSAKGQGLGEAAFNQDNSGVGMVRVRLRAGERLDLKLEAGFTRGGSAIAFDHDTPSLDRRAVLPSYLYPEPGAKRTLEQPVEKRDEVLADFAFEESSGALSRSTAGIDVFGRLTGATRRVTGHAGKGIEFAPTGQFGPASFAIDEELRLPAGDYTVAFWFKTTATNITLCQARRRSSYNNRWSDHHVLVEPDKLVFRLRDDRQLEAKGDFHDGQWHHVATTVGSGGQRLVVDGRLMDTGKLSRRVLDSNRLGFDLGPDDGDGVVVIDELTISGRALSVEDIARRLKKP